jgi:hypothetical protein
MKRYIERGCSRIVYINNIILSICCIETIKHSIILNISFCTLNYVNFEIYSLILIKLYRIFSFFYELLWFYKNAIILLCPRDVTEKKHLKVLPGCSDPPKFKKDWKLNKTDNSCMQIIQEIFKLTSIII